MANLVVLTLVETMLSFGIKLLGTVALAYSIKNNKINLKRLSQYCED